jgi:membrane complex biogenesis BtpA family protein
MPTLQELIPQWSAVTKPVIGMLHLPPLPGSPRYSGDLNAVTAAVLRDAEALSAGAVHGMMLENFGDVPFYPRRVPAYVVAHMTAIACAVRARFELPLGINVLRNDGQSALAVAHAAGAAFIRVNVLCGARVADQGVVEAIAHDLLRDRATLGANGIRVFADVDVKHSAPLAPRPLADEVADTLHRGLADALIVSGSGTGKPTDPEQVRDVRTVAAGVASVLVGSGVSARTIPEFLPHAEGFIIGTAFKPSGDPSRRVDVQLVKELMATFSR